MKIKETTQTEYGPFVEILLTGNEVATAIDAYLVARGVTVRGPRTISVNEDMIGNGHVLVDPSGFVVYDGKRYGRGS